MKVAMSSLKELLRRWRLARGVTLENSCATCWQLRPAFRRKRKMADKAEPIIGNWQRLRVDMLRSTEDLNSGDAIVIHGAREHNLKNLSLSIPRDKFVVITGVSGSGKSTLAFDLIFAEG